MLSYLLRRILIIVPTLFLISILTFIVIELPPGDYVGGLFFHESQEAEWSFAKVIALCKHLWIPMIVIVTAGTAGLIRVLRANLLDEIRKPYVDLTDIGTLISDILLAIVDPRIRYQVILMYLGAVAEQGRVTDIFDRPQHPYPQALLESIPTLDTKPKKPKSSV